MRPTSVIAALFLAFCFLAPDASAELRLPGVFSDHMVLQRGEDTRIWGWADPGTYVRIRISDAETAARADSKGRWSTHIDLMRSGGPYTLRVITDEETLKIKDVYIGEVWLCSGQSNMEWPVSRAADAKQEIKAARYPKIRHIKVPHRASGDPQSDIDAAWEICSPETVGNFSACGYYMAREIHRTLKVPVGLINASWGGTRIEPWINLDGFERERSLRSFEQRVWDLRGKKPKSHQQPSVLYNGMIAPVVGYGMRGAVWYQGESNHKDGAIYTDKMKALIGGWREAWNRKAFPFYFVQIAPYRYGNEHPSVLPAFWEAQTKVLDQVPFTAMAVTHDIATLDDIHPPNKQDVGDRLARIVLRRLHRRSGIEDRGPELASMWRQGSFLRLRFNAAIGLKTRDRKPPSHFEIAADGTGFVPAKATIKGDTITLRADGVANPRAMRFGWHKLAQPNLVNHAGLPARPFRKGRVELPDSLPEVTQAFGYSLIYDLRLDGLGAEPRYAVDKSKTFTESFDKIGYLLELQPEYGKARYVWVSMDAWVDDLKRIAIPTVQSRAHFQQTVTGMCVASNVPQVRVGKKQAGTIEFWPNNYGPDNSAAVPFASDKLWDFGDAPGSLVAGYGSMQVHNPKAEQTVFAINNWRAGAAAADIGIGNSDTDKRTRDWTFAGNAASYLAMRLRVFVRPK